ncbi:FCD domain-containing protein [Caballeronia mineralivorans]|jgi:hypothetical protein|uniref:FCD domain-containing protein n=1 Tax=Caballeronia mineralivorans TaxID=2010198 RepID=UPI002AFFA2FE|nr:FCD domain-containing protein [Caballeronia mineralivorans]
MKRSSWWICIIFGRRATSSHRLVRIAAETPEFEISVARIERISQGRGRLSGAFVSEHLLVASRYRRLSIQKAFPSRHVADEHQAIMSAVLSGRADDAVALLKAHYKQTAAVILQDQRIFPELHDNA